MPEEFEIELVLNDIMGTGGEIKTSAATSWYTANKSKLQKMTVDDLENVHIYTTAGTKIKKKEQVEQYIKGKKLCTRIGMVVGLLIRGVLAYNNSGSKALLKMIISLLSKVVRKETEWAPDENALMDAKYCTHMAAWKKLKQIERGCKKANLSELEGVDQEAIKSGGRKHTTGVGKAILEKKREAKKTRQEKKEEVEQAKLTKLLQGADQFNMTKFSSILAQS